MKDETFTDISHDGDEPVSRLLAGLPRVAAPSDFEFRLRGRIAKGRPAQRAGFRLPAAVTYALGLSVVLVVFGLLGVAWMYSGPAGEVPAVATTSSAPIALPERREQPKDSAPAVTGPVISEPVNKAVQDVEFAAKRDETPASPRSARVEPATEVSNSANTGSVAVVSDQALRNARLINPKGINPNAGNTAPDANVALGRPIETKEVLLRVGVRASFAGGGWKVESVTPGSSADKSGIKAGDVIQAINGDAVTIRSAFTDRFFAKSLGVLRDGKVVQIALEK